MNSQDIFNKRICQAVKASTIEVRDTAQEKHRFTSRTGNLEKAVDYRISNSGMQGVVFIDSDVAKYGPFVHAGTPAHVIRPHFKKILRFVPQGGNGFILYEALQNNVSNITSIFSRYTGIALDDVAQGLVKDEITLSFEI